MAVGIRLPKLPKVRRTRRPSRSFLDPLTGERRTADGSGRYRGTRRKPAQAHTEPRSARGVGAGAVPTVSAPLRPVTRRGQRLTPLSDRPNVIRPKARERFDDVSVQRRVQARIDVTRAQLEAQKARRGVKGKPRGRFGAEGARTTPEQMGAQMKARPDVARGYTFGPTRAVGKAKRPASAVRDPRKHPATRQTASQDPHPSFGSNHPYFRRRSEERSVPPRTYAELQKARQSLPNRT